MRVCECGKSTPVVQVLAKCPVIITADTAVPRFGEIEFHSDIRCDNCGYKIEPQVLQCPFLITRLIVESVCNSCVSNDGKVHFATDLNMCRCKAIPAGVITDE